MAHLWALSPAHLASLAPPEQLLPWLSAAVNLAAAVERPGEAGAPGLSHLRGMHPPLPQRWLDPSAACPLSTNATRSFFNPDQHQPLLPPALPGAMLSIECLSPLARVASIVLFNRDTWPAEGYRQAVQQDDLALAVRLVAVLAPGLPAAAVALALPAEQRPEGFSWQLVAELCSVLVSNNWQTLFQSTWACRLACSAATTAAVAAVAAAALAAARRLIGCCRLLCVCWSWQSSRCLGREWKLRTSCFAAAPCFWASAAGSSSWQRRRRCSRALGGAARSGCG